MTITHERRKEIARDSYYRVRLRETQEQKEKKLARRREVRNTDEHRKRDRESQAKYRARRKLEDPDFRKAESKRYYEENHLKLKEYQLRYQNTEHGKQKRKESYRRNYEAHYLRGRLRSQRHNSPPPWADREEIKRIYKEARDRREAGESVQVDHIIPITAKRDGVHIACGLHVENNLQIVSSNYNFVKQSNIDHETYQTATSPDS